MRKLRIFFNDWVRSTFNYHPVLIWSNFNTSKTLIQSDRYTPLRGYPSWENTIFCFLGQISKRLHIVEPNS
jgi:hypothetical protein